MKGEMKDIEMKRRRRALEIEWKADEKRKEMKSERKKIKKGKNEERKEGA
jgi:hypothetical protein